MGRLDKKKKINNIQFNARRIITFLVFMIAAVAVHRNILLLQNRYLLEIGPGDADYFTVNKGIEFGLRYGDEWVRDMWQRSFVHLPFKIHRESVRLDFQITSYSRSEKVIVSNNQKEVVAGFSVPAAVESAVYSVSIPVDKLPGGKLEIKLSSGDGRYHELDLQLNRVYMITSGGGTSLPWKHDLLFFISIAGFWIMLGIAGFKTLHGCIGTGIFAFLAVVGRFLDPVSYIEYLRVFVFPCLPFLILSVSFIRYILPRFSLFKKENIRIIVILFLIGFIVHYIGLFYPSHLNSDGNLRINFFRMLEKNGLSEFLGEMSRQHSAATGTVNKGIPYPPWFNLLAMPFIKAGMQDHLWLRFQFLMIISFYLILIYALARQLGLSANGARLAAFFSIFAAGMLRDISRFTYDPIFAFTLSLIFFIEYFKRAENLPSLNIKNKLLLGIILGMVLVLHPNNLLLIGLLFALALVFFAAGRLDEKWKTAAAHTQIGVIGFILSLLMFYGMYFKDLLSFTIPNAVKNAAVSDFADGSSGFANMLSVSSRRVFNAIPVLLFLFCVYGFFILMKQLGKKKMIRTRMLLLSWAAVYLLIIIFRATGLFFNFIKYLPEYEFIYPVVFISLGFVFSELYEKYKKKPAIRLSLISLIILTFAFNLAWFYCSAVGMAPRFGILIERFIQIF